MKLVTKIVTFPFKAIKLTYKTLVRKFKEYRIEFKYKGKTILTLIILLHWIYGYAYITGSTFYEQYTEVAKAENIVSGDGRESKTIIQANKNVIPGTEAWIKEQWETRTNAKWENIYAVIQGESGWNSDAWNCNNNGSLDLGLYQGNSVHKELTPSCALNTVCATNWAIDIYNEQGLTPWVAAKKLGLTK